MGESGNEKAVSKTNRKHQAGTTTIKKGWVKALPIKVSLAITFSDYLGCVSLLLLLYFDNHIMVKELEIMVQVQWLGYNNTCFL